MVVPKPRVWPHQIAGVARGIEQCGWCQHPSHIHPSRMYLPSALLTSASRAPPKIHRDNGFGPFVRGTTPTSHHRRSRPRWPRNVRAELLQSAKGRLGANARCRPEKSRILNVRLLSMAMTGFFYTFQRPRTARPMGLLKYDPIGRLAITTTSSTPLVPPAPALDSCLLPIQCGKRCCSSNRNGKAANRQCLMRNESRAPAYGQIVQLPVRILPASIL